MRNRHKWEENTPLDILGEMRRNPIVYFVTGMVEDHGAHLATGADFTPPYAMALEAVEKTGGMVFPVLPLSPAGIPFWDRRKLRAKELDLGPSVFVSGELCRLAYTEVLESIADIGFKICIAQGGHWPGIKLLREISEAHDHCINGMHMVCYDWLGEAQELYKDKYKIQHGNIIETSVVMHTCPDYYCDATRVDEDIQKPLEAPEMIHNFSDEDRRQIREEASAQIGKEICDLALQRMYEHVAELRKELGC